MLKEEIIKSFSQLGNVLNYLSNSKSEDTLPFPLDKNDVEHFQSVVRSQRLKNGWFTEDNVWLAIKSHADNLSSDKLQLWQNSYGISKNPKSILVIMAGNIPLVGFHDFVSVLMSGNKIKCKLSSEDNTLLPIIASILIKINPNFQKRIEFVNGPAKDFDAVIATGSDNTIKQFMSYFRNYPCLFRKNRTSLAILNGTETDEELQRLGTDIFSYFGLGCRNVSHLMVPKDYDIDVLFKNIVSFSNVIHHHKYANNYDYNRAVFLLNNIEFLDNNFFLLNKNEDINSPIAVINYHHYDTMKDVEDYIKNNFNSIQVIIGKKYLDFGRAQSPGWEDYADNLNSLDFLLNL
jgi:hypothetical protein